MSSNPTQQPAAGTSSSDTTQTPAAQTINKISTRENPAVDRVPEPLDEHNWIVWRERMLPMLRLCGVAKYIAGTIPRPKDPEQAQNWDFNDDYAKVLIQNNITQPQMIHTSQCTTASAKWASLEAMHEPKGHQTTMAVLRSLLRTVASDDMNVVEHLNVLKANWERLNALGETHLHISDIIFKVIISSSLPESWDNFTRPYVEGDAEAPDPTKVMGSQRFMGLIKEEYIRRIDRTHHTESVNQATSSNLANRLNAQRGPKKQQNNGRCKQCGYKNHTTENCRFLGQNKCPTCNHFGHLPKDCWFKDKPRKRKGEQSGNRSAKKAKNESVNEAKSEEKTTDTQNPPKKLMAFNVVEDEVPTTATIEEIREEEVEVAVEWEENENITLGDNAMYYANVNPDIQMCDWLADSATTSHVANDRKVFRTYEESPNTFVTGVGGLRTEIKGRGTVDLLSNYKGQEYVLRLNDVLHIPSNKNNLISLGRWDNAGGTYRSDAGVLKLAVKRGTVIAIGRKVRNHLYKMLVKVSDEKQKKEPLRLTTDKYLIFLSEGTPESWETWHKRFGHVSYTGLQTLLDKDLVLGFNVDTRTPKPDCVACTEAKQFEEPYNKKATRQTKPGELTHIDLWGKYEVTSINGHQYYALFVDDASRYMTLRFLKGKNEAAQVVKNYLTHLETHGRTPRAIRTDRGKEFVNEALQSWCQSKGIDNQLTAPYSPSQNGIAERANRTLVELARAMINAQSVPEFLWEHAIDHASYIRNRSYTRTLEGETPYEIWHGLKPSVAHLREFGIPVWVLLQGQAEQRKILPKSKRRIYVGHEDGPQAIKYYNADVRKVLTSRNYRFLTPSQEAPSPDVIAVAPDTQREGEPGRDALSSSDASTTGGQLRDMDRSDAPTMGGQQNVQSQPEGKNSDSLKRKRFSEVEEQMDTPRKTRGIKRDYRQLNDPFPEEGDEDQYYIAQVEAILGGDDPKSLREAKRSLEWPEWERAIMSELDQLRQKGTWMLVKTPMDAIPLDNKWVFTKKYGRGGELLKYKGRLVVKGFAQRPGFDYVETFSPVVRMETLRAILALSALKRLEIGQLDVKGAYLNGTLKERVYMRQPEGYDDGTERSCLLIKTLYGLKQSGREWNNEFDSKVKRHTFTRLTSDPCVYVRRDKEDLEIITVWVDDLMLFATSKELMERIKTDIKSEWEVTDLGEPTKIVGIEITKKEGSITISQERYIEAILERENMTRVNPVATPLDPNVPLEPNPEGNKGSKSNAYARLLGELQYLANATRPDIAFAVNRLASYTANPSLQHTGALKRILRYLAGTRTLGITYSAMPSKNRGSNLFEGYADAAYMNVDEYRSTSGYVFIVGGGAISWMSRKQSTVALSTANAEYVALSEAGREACWLRNLFEELGFPQLSPTVIHGDNDGSIAMAKNPQFHKKSKHIATKWHWIREQTERETISLHSIRDPEQTADILTKSLARPKHKRHVAEMGLAPT